MLGTALEFPNWFAKWNVMAKLPPSARSRSGYISLLLRKAMGKRLARVLDKSHKGLSSKSSSSQLDLHEILYRIPALEIEGHNG